MLLTGVLLVPGSRDSLPSQAQDSAKTIKVRVSVTDPLNRFVADLELKQFKISAGRATQSITYFAHKSALISGVFVFDMAIPDHQVRIESVRKTITGLLQPETPVRELVLISFDSKAARVETFTHEGSTAKDSLPLPRAGSSPLTAAVRMGLDQLQSLTGEKKALIVITRNTNSLMVELPPKPDFQLFAIATAGRVTESSKSSSIYDLTGGREYVIGDFDQLNYYVDLIRDELQNEYILGFVSSSGKIDPKRLKVEVSQPPGQQKLIVHSHLMQ